MKKQAVLVVTLLAFCVGSSATLAQVVQPKAPSVGAAAQSAGGLTTIPVTIDFRDAEVVQIYQVLGDLAGLNVIADPTVKGRFTVSLKGEPLNRALDLIAGTTGFGYTLVSNTLVVAAPERLQAFTKRELSVLSVNSLAPETAKSLMEAAAPGVTVTLDAAQKLVLVSGTPEQVQAASLALTKFDVPAAKEFEFVDKPVSDILRELARSAGLSVMLEGNLSAKLTVYLKDMPVRDAINLVAARAGVQQETTPSGVLVFRPVSISSPSEPTQTTVVQGPETQAMKLKYIAVSVAADMLSSMYPSLEVKTGKDESFLFAKGPAGDLNAAFAFLAKQDFPVIRLAGVVQHESGLRAVVEVAGVSHVVQQGQSIDDLTVEELTVNSVTIRRGERREVIMAGGALK